MDVPSGNSDMVERVARAISGAPFPTKRSLTKARAAIEAITAGQFVEYRVTSPDGELFAETAGTPAAAYAEAQHYAMQEPGAVIEQVVCLPALSPSLKEQERT